MLKPNDSVENIPFIGTKYKELLGKLGISTVSDLIYHSPTYHTDTSDISQIVDLNSFEKKTVNVTIEQIKNIRTKFRKWITQAKAYDDSGKIDIIWFNQPYLTRTVKEGSQILLNGKLNPRSNKPQLYSPTYEMLRNEAPTHLGRIVPIYATTEGVTAKWLRSRIQFVIKKHNYLLDDIEDNIPQNIRRRYELTDLKTAIEQIHFPKNVNSLKSAKKRLAFDELLAIQIKLTKKRQKRKKQKAPGVKSSTSSVKRFLDNLDFTPTKAQKRAVAEILKDFENKFPANRLLAGDVGSGKTLVAAAVSIPVVESGYQVAIMAPTAILAKQHFETFQQQLGKKYKVQLVTGATKQSFLRSDLIIGTHALLHRREQLFDKLGLIIIDEQHRFGVKQRALLANRSSLTCLPSGTVVRDQKNATISKRREAKIVPHRLTMTATPIPRSIALTLFGDLDVSLIDEMPKGRLPTKTFLVPDNKRKNAYQWLEDMVVKNSQLFWICPLIEESEKLQTKAVITEYGRLENKIFPELKIDFLHGRLSEEEKNGKIKRMVDGKTDILVSTTVIEVGMDIPGANIIVIEGAERFGLAQLHQLRGRVGRRANQKSWCFLFSSKNASEEAIKRLQYFSTTNDGLKVAEYDLKRRGPGEVYGTKQAGIPDLKVARFDDLKLIQKTREAAELVAPTS